MNADVTSGVVLVVCALVSGLSFLYYGFKVLSQPASKTEFERYGVPGVRRLVGILEVLGGAGVILGLAFAWGALELAIPAYAEQNDASAGRLRSCDSDHTSNELKRLTHARLNNAREFDSLNSTSTRFVWHRVLLAHAHGA